MTNTNEVQYPVPPRLNPEGNGYICDHCQRTWGLGETSGCKPCRDACEAGQPVATKLHLAQSQSEIWQHVKSGGLYRLETYSALIEDGITQAAIYRSLWDGQVWVRPVAEFFDGRFRNLAVDEITDCRPLADRGDA